ncbi:MAG TPA: chromosomal replication initiator protein DnaA [Candidatus Babeliales bacterium]|nr:chromosomal replication initiator protein DnaA [Candidatus Babeliales bacterium]
MLVTVIWEDFLKIVKNDVGSRVVETWFKSMSFERWDGESKIVYLKVPNLFVRDWVRNNYMLIIQTHLGRLLHVLSPSIVFVQNSEKSTSGVIVSRDTDIKKTSDANISFAPALLDKKAAYPDRVYTFNTFVVGPSNSLAYAAAHAVTEQPGYLYNPLFIYGRAGLGKTHLLHSIGNTLKANNKNAVVLYQSTDRFVNEFITAIRFNKVQKFHAKYKSIDALLMDDVQFIAKKEQTQEAFFHIFNFLYESRKQIVLSSDVTPQSMQGLADRLQSRFGGGLVTDIHLPSLETKIAIVKKKAELSGEILHDDVAHFIAAATVASIRELEGALIRVMAYSSLTQERITVDVAKKVLGYPLDVKMGGTDFDAIVNCMQKYYPYNRAQLCSKARNQDLSFARQVAMYLCKTVANKSLREIGDFLGGRDHSTVVHAINKIKRYADEQEGFREQLRQMEQDTLR